MLLGAMWSEIEAGLMLARALEAGPEPVRVQGPRSRRTCARLQVRAASVIGAGEGAGEGAGGVEGVEVGGVGVSVRVVMPSSASAPARLIKRRSWVSPGM